MTATAWGQLADTDAGQPITVHFWWDDAPTAGTFIRTLGLYDYQTDGAPLYRHVIDYGGEIGEQETQLAADAPVALGATTAPPPQMEPPPTNAPPEEPTPPEAPTPSEEPPVPQ